MTEMTDDSKKLSQIIIVEDDINLQELLLRKLKKEGYECIAFSTGESVINYVNSNTECIILLDQKLPDMTGRDIILAIKKTIKDIPFIVMTGQGDERLAVEMMKIGASDYLIKDIEFIDILPGVLERVLNKQRIESRLKETEDHLKIALDKNIALLNSLPDMIFIINDHYEFIDYFPKNRSFDFLQNPLSFLGKRIDEVFESDLSQKIKEKIDLVLQNGVMEFADYQIEKNGKTEFYESRFISFGKNEVLVIERDVTEKKKSEEEKHKLESQLMQSQKLESIGRLAGGVAHDFNNMLSGILGAAQLLKFTCNQDGKANDYIDLIIKTSERAADLTSKLLTFSRRNSLSAKNIDMHNLVMDTILILKRSIDKKILIHEELTAGNSMVYGDSSLIHNALINMGINASHAMPEGGILTFTSKNVYLNESYCRQSAFDISEGEYIEIEIRDSGTGISNENLSKIFDPFFTTKEPGKGTGLGLSIVYGLVRDSKGAISVESTINEGSCFHIFFPVSTESIQEEVTTEKIGKADGEILLVDDEEFIRKIGSDLLSSIGYKVITAENGAEAVRIFSEKQDQIDMVFLDMIMPVMGGKETFFKLKELKKDLRIIITSGYFRESDIKELKEIGLDDVIEKPYKIEELYRVLNKNRGRDE
jgi:signal transduction histidine kinase